MAKKRITRTIIIEGESDWVSDTINRSYFGKECEIDLGGPTQTKVIKCTSFIEEMINDKDNN